MKLKALLEHRSTALWLVAHNQSPIQGSGLTEPHLFGGVEETLTNLASGPRSPPAGVPLGLSVSLAWIVVT